MRHLLKGSGSLGSARAARLLPSNLHLHVWPANRASGLQLRTVRAVQCLHSSASLRSEAVRPSCDAVGLVSHVCGAVQASAACGSLERPSAAQQQPLRLAPGEVHVWWLFPEDVRFPSFPALPAPSPVVVTATLIYATVTDLSAVLKPVNLPAEELCSHQLSLTSSL